MFTYIHTTTFTMDMQMRPLWDDVYYKELLRNMNPARNLLDEEICLETDPPPTEQSTSNPQVVIIISK